MSATSLELLDQLHEHISAGGKMDDFALVASPKTQQHSRQTRPTRRAHAFNRTWCWGRWLGWWMRCLRQAAKSVYARHLRPASPLQHLLALEQAATAG